MTEVPQPALRALGWVPLGDNPFQPPASLSNENPAAHPARAYGALDESTKCGMHQSTIPHLCFGGDFGGGGAGDRSTGVNCCVSQASMITDCRAPL